MKYLPYTLILCLVLSFGFIADFSHDKEIKELKEEIKLLNQQVSALQDLVVVTDDKCDRIKAEVADMVRPFTRVIPVRGGFLGVRGESPPYPLLLAK
jgi:hypothetical protein